MSCSKLNTSKRYKKAKRQHFKRFKRCYVLSFIYLHFARKDRANVILPSLSKKLIGHVQKLT